MEGMPTLTDEEFAQAIENVRQQRKKRGVTVPRDNLTCPAEEWSVRMAAVRAKLRRSLRLPPEDQDDDDILY